jgi:hypothetical protein
MNAPAPKVDVEQDTLDTSWGGFDRAIASFRRHYVDGCEITERHAPHEHPDAIETTATEDTAERFCCPARLLEWNGEPHP